MIQTKPLDIPRLQILSEEVGEWANRNFKSHAPILGIFEEIGELAHGLLKRHQSIRGFDDPKKFQDHTEDAIGDIAIYALHGAYIGGVRFLFVGVAVTSFDHTILIAQLSKSAVTLAENSADNRREYFRLFSILNELAASLDIDFMAVVEATWARVSKRNWTANPKNADKVAAAAELGDYAGYADAAPIGGFLLGDSSKGPDGIANGGLAPVTKTVSGAGNREPGADVKTTADHKDKAPEGKSGETTVEKTGLTGENSPENAPGARLTGNGPANAAPIPDPTLAKEFPEVGENASGKKGDGDTHKEPSTVIVVPANIKWSKSLPKAQGDYYFHHKNSPDPKDQPAPQTVSVVDREGVLHVTSAEVKLDGNNLDIPLADLGTEFHSMKFAKKDLPTV